LTEANVVRSIRSVGEWSGTPLLINEWLPEEQDVAVVLEAPNEAPAAVLSSLPNGIPWCPGSGWNSAWRDLRQHEDIVLCCKVYWLIDELCGERLPAINLAHVDLA
jgi:hypothetical protein